LHAQQRWKEETASYWHPEDELCVAAYAYLCWIIRQNYIEPKAKC
jgi:hypothetical protein